MMMWPKHVDDLTEYEIAVHDLIYRSSYSKIVVDMVYVEERAKMIQFLWHSHYITSHLNYPGFRNGPMPGTGHCRNGWWRKHRGSHSNSVLAEYKYDCGMFADIEEILSLPIIHTHLYRPSRACEVKFWAIEYDSFHDYYGKGRGWKRSRKRKQWN